MRGQCRQRGIDGLSRLKFLAPIRKAVLRFGRQFSDGFQSSRRVATRQRIFDCGEIPALAAVQGPDRHQPFQLRQNPLPPVFGLRAQGGVGDGGFQLRSSSSRKVAKVGAPLAAASGSSDTSVLFADASVDDAARSCASGAAKSWPEVASSRS